MEQFAFRKYTYMGGFIKVHEWRLVHEKGGISFRAFIHDKHSPSCGLEFHSVIGDGAPSQLNCTLTGGRCWHSWMSLYATETLWPMIELYLRAGDHSLVFKTLETEAIRYFNLNVPIEKAKNEN